MDIELPKVMQVLQHVRRILFVQRNPVMLNVMQGQGSIAT